MNKVFRLATLVRGLGLLGLLVLATASWSQKLSLSGTLRGLSSTGVGSVSGTPNWTFKLKSPTSSKLLRPGMSVDLDSRERLMLRNRLIGLGPISWACTSDWTECWCNKGSDCDAICKGTPTCTNPNVPDECSCKGDPKKGSL